MMLVIGSEGHKIVNLVREGFLCPHYALTAGNSDDLLKICRVGKVKKIEGGRFLDFQNTVLIGDQTAVYEPLIDIKNTPITESIRAPEVFLLPTAFDFSDGERRVIRKEHFTFIGSPVRLKDTIPAFQIGKEAVVLL